MEIMSWINGLSPFIQSILASLVLLAISGIFQFLRKSLKDSYSEVRKIKAELRAYQPSIYKHYLESDDLLKRSAGTLFILVMALRHTMLALMFVLLGASVNFLLEGDLFFAIIFCVAFNYTLVARAWLGNHSGEKYVENLSEETPPETQKNTYSNVIGRD